MRKIFTLLALFCAITTSAQIRFTFVNPQTDQMKIRNFGNTTVDISSYRLCALFAYQTLNVAGITIDSGDLNLSPAEEVTLTWTGGGGLNATSSDLGLYLPNPVFSNPADMVDFFQYGNSGQGRESVANSAGIWVAGTFMTGSGPWYYTGNGSSGGLQNWSDQLPVSVTQVVINELDCDQTGTDMTEFIELYGTPNAPLDGLVVVFFNGAGDISYAAYDLDGYSLNGSGFFVLGNTLVPNVGLVFPNNSLQNGADAVAVYIGDASSWPNNSPVSSANLMDAIVYGTDDATDTGLIAALTPLQSQANEGASATAVAVSLSRIPDGGNAFETSLFVTQAPTPGVSNLPQCFGGSIAADNSNSPIEICDDAVDLVVAVSNTGVIGNGSYLYVLSQNGIIVSTYQNVTEIDLSAFTNGTYHITGLTFTGNINTATAAPGQPASGITSDACFSYASNAVQISKVACTVSFCNGGTVSNSEGLTYVSLCKDGDADFYSFLTTSNASEAEYAYVITSGGETIIQVVNQNSFDLDLLPLGNYRIYGLSYIGSLVASSIASGQPVSGIAAENDECTALSFNYIEVNVLDCTPGQPCAQLYFSEYIEGTSNNKAIEIYNPTGVAVNLDDYDVLRYTNGAVVPGPVIALTGILGPGEVYVIANSQANAAILAQADVTGGIAAFNGDDALVLTYNLSPIDVIGVIGQDPGTEWTFGTGSTLDKVLVRKPNVNAPTTDWTLSSGQWLVYPVDDFSHLGAHNAFPCGSEAVVDFSVTAQLVPENVGNVSVVVNAYNVSGPFSVTIDVGQQSTTPDVDYVDIFPLTLNFDVDMPTQVFELQIIDEDIEEFLYEFLTLEITVNGSAVSPIGTQTITIEPSDRTYDLYPISDIITNDLNGMPDSLGVFCAIRGIVHGINFNPAGIQFTLIDGPGGIKVFDPDDDFGYTVAEGDSVMVFGQVANFLGMNEFYPDDILFINSGNELEIPELVSSLSEANESHMVRMECVELVNPAQWTNSQNGFYVDVSDGTNTFKMHIDLDTDIYGTNPPAGHFSVTGIGAQLDIDGIPYDSGYTFWPRYIEDIYDEVVADFEGFTELIFGDNGAEVAFVNNSIGATEFLWSFGDDNFSGEEEPAHSYSFAFLAANPEIIIGLQVTGDNGCSDDTAISVETVYVGMEEFTSAPVNVYPVPVRDLLTVKCQGDLEQISVYDNSGKLLYSVMPMHGEFNTIDFSRFAAGSYIVRISTGDGVIYKSVIRQ